MKFYLATEIFDDKTQQIALMVSPQTVFEPLPFGKVVAQLLLAPPPQNTQQSPDTKVQHYKLLRKVLDYSDAEVDFSLSEVGIIKALADTNSPVLVHGRIMEILEAPLPS